MIAITGKYSNVTICLPAMDETYSLRWTVEEILETCDRKDLCELIILLCDRSTSECKRTAEKLCRKHEAEIPIYIHYQKMPFVGGAIREGFELAQGSHVILMSSDLETDPMTVRQFIEQAKANPDCVITASRWKKGVGFEGYNKVKLVANFIFQKIIALLFLTRMTDITYGYRIFPTRLVQSIRWEELKHPFFLETALKPLRLGVRFIEVPSPWKARTEGNSVNSFWANFAYFKTAWHVRWMAKENILLDGQRTDKEI